MLKTLQVFLSLLVLFGIMYFVSNMNIGDLSPPYFEEDRCTRIWMNLLDKMDEMQSN